MPPCPRPPTEAGRPTPSVVSTRVTLEPRRGSKHECVILRGEGPRVTLGAGWGASPVW